MNSRFWEWIVTVNARLVFLATSLICLAVVSGRILLGGHEGAALNPPWIPGDPGTDVPPAAAPGEPALAGSDLAAATSDPFVSEYLTSLQREEERRREAALRRKEAARTTKPDNAAAPAPAAPPPQARFLYRGMFTRPDGTVLALIENQTSGRTAFFRENDRIEGLLVGSISRSSVSLGDPGNAPLSLAVGEPSHIDLEP